MRYAIAVLLLTGCAPTPAQPVPKSMDDHGIRVFQDEARNVTCWILYSRAISCLPDSHIIRVKP